jgi:hypothetical protein
MANAGVQKKQTGEASSVGRAFWDPFWFMREMLGWGRSGGPPSFEVKETDDAYVCNVKLTLPEQADVAHMKAELDNGELTVVVPKAAAPAPGSAPPTRRRTSGSRHGAAANKPRHRPRPPSRRG